MDAAARKKEAIRKAIEKSLDADPMMKGLLGGDSLSLSITDNDSSSEAGIPSLALDPPPQLSRK